jgi:regulator of protease activity HflC (stomatin/prohibitin superfamily)
MGWIFEYGRQQIDLMEYLGLAEYAGRSILEIMIAIDPRKSIEILIAIVLLIAKLSPTALLNSSPVIIAMVGIPRLASHFAHTLYDTKDIDEARKFLRRNMLGMRTLRPLMIVKEGYVFVGAGDLYDRVGGRGLLIVYNDSAVVIERGGQLVSIRGPSLNFLGPFERIWGIVDLRPQRWPLTVSAMSKEGIPISCEAIVTFKIDDRFVDENRNVQVKLPVETKTQLPSSDELDEEIAKELRKAGIGEPLPYTDEAVLNATTCIWIRIQQPDHEEQLRKWTGRVIISGTEGTLRNILANYRLDWLLRPPQPGQEHPREEIRKQLEEKLLDSFPVGNNVGAKILNVELGEIAVRDVKDKNGKPFGIPDKVYTQWLKTWQAEWEQRAVEDQIEGEAELARLQAAQVQAQAEMVLTLTEAIRPLVTSKDDVSSYMLAMRFVEALRWMAYDPFKRVFMPPEIMRTLDELEKTMGKEVERPSGGTISEINRFQMEGRGLVERKVRE